MKNNFFPKFQKRSGATLLEFVLVIIITSTIFLSIFRSTSGNVDRKRAFETIDELKAIFYAMIGDEERVEFGERTDFGFWGDNADWPDNASIAAFRADVASYLQIGTSGTTDIGEDGWGNNYVLTENATSFTVESYGADGANGGSGYDQDIQFVIQKNDWEQNSIAIYVVDAKGTLLIPCENSGDLVTGHVAEVDFTENGGAIYDWISGNGGASELTNTNNGYYLSNTVLAGSCTVAVTVADGTAGGPPYMGTYDWADDLNRSSSTIDTVNFVIYPKGSTSQVQTLIVKTPGPALSGFNEV